MVPRPLATKPRRIGSGGQWTSGIKNKKKSTTTVTAYVWIFSFICIQKRGILEQGLKVRNKIVIAKITRNSHADFTFNNNLDLMTLSRRGLTPVHSRVFLLSAQDTQPILQLAVSSRVICPAFLVFAFYAEEVIRWELRESLDTRII